MLTENQSVGERRTGSLTMVKKIVEARRDMLALYNQLAERKPFHEDDEQIQEILQEFCEALVDYTAHAHFQLYRYFAEKRERRSEVLAVVTRIYPKIMDVTQLILEFNDKYDASARTLSLRSLERDLSTLGEGLAERIELEDRLIDVWVNPGADRH